MLTRCAKAYSSFSSVV